MKRIFFIIPTLFSALFLPAQIRIDWQQCYGSLSEDKPFVITDSDNGFYVAGLCGSSDGLVDVELSPDNGWIAEIDNQGTLIHQQSPALLPIWMGKMTNPYQDYYLMGYRSKIYPSTYEHLSILRQDSSGNVLFERQLTGSGAFSLFQDVSGQGATIVPDGGMVGYCSISGDGGDISNYYGDWDAWLFKVDTNGELLWKTTLGTQGAEYAQGVFPLADNTLIALVSGKPSGNGSIASDNHNPESSDGIVIMLHKNGSILGSHCYGGIGNETLCHVIELEDGLVFLGNTTSMDGDLENAGFHPSVDSGKDLWLMKTDSEGNILWSKCYGGSGEERAIKAFKNSDGGFTLFGMTDSNDGDVASIAPLEDPWQPLVQRIWVVRTDNMGEILWERVIGTFESSTPLVDVLKHNEKEYTILAQSFCTYGNASGDYLCSNEAALPYSHYNYWILHVSDIFDYTGVEEKQGLTNKMRIRPNPVGDILSIEFSPDVTPAIVELYDLQGRRILTQTKALDRIPMEGLPSGTYLVRVTMDDGSTFSDKVVKK